MDIDSKYMTDLLVHKMSCKFVGTSRKKNNVIPFCLTMFYRHGMLFLKGMELQLEKNGEGEARHLTL